MPVSRLFSCFYFNIEAAAWQGAMLRPNKAAGCKRRIKSAALFAAAGRGRIHGPAHERGQRHFKRTWCKSKNLFLIRRHITRKILQKICKKGLTTTCSGSMIGIEQRSVVHLNVVEAGYRRAVCRVYTYPMPPFWDMFLDERMFVMSNLAYQQPQALDNLDRKSVV